MASFIPTPLRHFAAGQEATNTSAGTVGEALDRLPRTHPGLGRHLFTREGRLRAFVNLYLNDEGIRYPPAREETAVGTRDTLSIIPSIAGAKRRGYRPPSASGFSIGSGNQELRIAKSFYGYHC